jgi:hypothetical protein
MEMMEQKTPEPDRGERTMYHYAAVDAFKVDLAEPERNGDVEIFSEYQLYTEPPRIDILIIVKKADIEMKSSVCKFFRTYNIIEYKSPADSALTIHDFDKTVHGYAGFYASQSGQRRTDMTATIICFKKPTELFEELENDFDYKILQNGNGIYYITNKGTPVEKRLAVQIVVTTELPDSELALGTIGVELNGETAKKVLKFIEQNKGQWDKLGYWLDVQYSKNHEILYKEAKMTGRQMLFRNLVVDSV